MVRRSEPDYVSGRRGRYEISPPIVHPAFCVCRICPAHRQKAAARLILRAMEVGLELSADDAADRSWDAPLVIRARRACPSGARDSRPAAMTFARNFKVAEEERLQAAVEAAAKRRRALANAVSFGVVTDAYRAHLRAEGKRYDRAAHLIDNIEALLGRERDAESIGWDEYQELRAEVAVMAPETRRHYESMLLAMLSFATKHRVISTSSMGKVPLTSVTKTDAPVTWTRRELAVIMGPAMAQFEMEQAEKLRKPVKRKGRSAERRNDSRMPLRGLCLIAYFILARPVSNFRLAWEDIPDQDCRRFKLRQHKNARKAIKAEGPIAETLASYLRAIRPAAASGLVHANPVSGAAYCDIRKQWDRLVSLAGGILGYKLEGRKADFFTFRHTGASHLAEKTKNPVLIVKMMGDTNITTVMRHYFNLDFEFMQEMVTGWDVPQLERRDNKDGEKWTTN